MLSAKLFKFSMASFMVAVLGFSLREFICLTSGSFSLKSVASMSGVMTYESEETDRITFGPVDGVFHYSIESTYTVSGTTNSSGTVTQTYDGTNLTVVEGNESVPTEVSENDARATIARLRGVCAFAQSDVRDVKLSRLEDGAIQLTITLNPNASSVEDLMGGMLGDVDYQSGEVTVVVTINADGTLRDVKQSGRYTVSVMSYSISYNFEYTISEIEAK